MKEKNWEEILKKSAEQEEVPESLKPENMRKFLEESSTDKKKKSSYKWYGMAAAAASLVLIVFAGRNAGILREQTELDRAKLQTEQSDQSHNESAEMEIAKEEYDTSYDDLYRFFKEKERERIEQIREYENVKGENKQDVMEESIGETSSAAPEEDSYKEHADTNKQEEGVDEADIIKNDGRYLYQIITTDNRNHRQALQITDTEGGLKEVARIEGFDNIFTMYIWENTLVLIESGWAEDETDTTGDRAESAMEDVAYYDIARGNAYQKVYIYDITERSEPKEEKVFTIGGGYVDSRVTDGYFYCFTDWGVSRLESREDYKKYIPMIDGAVMDASSIYLPSKAETPNYLVMISIDLRNPTEIVDKKAVVASADRVYVSKTNIYVVDSIYDELIEEEGRCYNTMKLIRFSYGDGMMKKEAEGSVKGRLLDDMAINESDGYLRMAVTVESYKRETIKDEIYGFFLGYNTTDHKRDNGLYVLDEGLNIVGSIEGLAEDEQIYSARFMGDTGYFVTFQQVDPLFSVDLSNPENPTILGELKISGFSEYLHFYNENLLLGIGKEADEDTGRTQGMKLSMFDISNPADVTEQDKYDLSEYDYSQALYNYKAVMIDTNKNLFGFFAEGWSSESGEEQENYLLFSYEDGAFQQKMKIACDRNKNGIYTEVRGTYIGEVFYLMYSDGRIESYSLANGSQIESLAE